MPVALPPDKLPAIRTTNLRIPLPANVADHYQNIADISGKNVEDVVAERLTTCADYYDDDPGRPLHLNQEERQELERMLGKNIFSSRDALVLIRNAVSLRVGSQKIPLRPELLTRLKSRCIGMEWDAFLAQTVVHELERFANMR